MNNIAVIIVNYHCKDLVDRCCRSLTEYLNVEFDIIIVDNSEPSESFELSPDSNNYTVINPSRNVGFAAACNLGLKHALETGYSYYLLLNPDTRAIDDFLSPMIDCMEQFEEIGIMTPSILQDNESQELWFSPGRINWWRGKVEHDHVSLIDDDKDWQDADFLTGCVMLIRPQALESTGFMEEKYFLYFEDTDYSVAMKEKGWKLAYFPKAKVLHSPSSTTGYLSRLYLYYFARNQILFMKKWAKKHHLLFFMIFSVAFMVPAAIGYFGLLKRDIGRMKAYINGCFDGYKNKTMRNESLFSASKDNN